ncbi:MAG: response regulator transcription factor [Candidatus Melainabacteria bacterium]|nr:MAG: response regulator transcription factor [Candidatus Melainabacteria bacterium]
MAKILVIEDEKEMAETVAHVLRSEHHVVEVALSGNDALDKLRVSQYDLLILDLNLPGTDGLEICKTVRHQKRPVSILMVTGRKTLEEKERGLDLGADDYLTKPFHLKELQARVRALLRRVPTDNSHLVTIHDLSLDRKQHIVTKGGAVVKLLPTEFALLEFFMTHPDRVFTSTQIIEQVWPQDTDATDRAVTSCLNRLRSKLSDGEKFDLIETLYNEGYRMSSSPNKAQGS